MQKCIALAKCAEAGTERVHAQRLNITIKSNVVRLFAQKMKERGETNRSELLEFLMNCWIYQDPKTEECSPNCPFFEKEAKS